MGASEAELEYYAKGGLDRAIQLLLDPDRSDTSDEFSPKDIAPRGNVNMKVAQYWWVAKMISTRRPLREKMTLFWHNHFATASMKVDVPGVMLRQNDLLRENGLGGFRQLLIKVSQDPAMLYWLDNQFNVKGKPNENFAREIMELFTLGVGHYTEKDIQEAARAFTGWTYTTRAINRKGGDADKPAPNSKYVFEEERHDTGVKSILGNKGNWNGDDVCGILVGNPQCARFIATKMWVWFGYANPEAALVERLASTFRKSGMDIRTLVHAIMTAPEFYSEKCVRRNYKNPVDFCVTTVRQMGAGPRILSAAKEQDDPNDKNPKQRVGLLPAVAAAKASESMGMELLNPPDVSGWKTGPEWISSATMVERIKWGEKLFPKSTAPFVLSLIAPDGGGRAVADALISLFDAQLPAAKVAQLRQIGEDVAKGAVTARNADVVARAVTRVLFGSPEFQFC